jgi:DNA repair exonuclease SbcCD ATPase subunit
VVGLVVGWTRRISPMVAAQIADDRAGLKERLSTAVELSGTAARSDVAEAQIADAARHAQTMQPAQVLPWKAPPQWRYLAGAAALLLAVIYVPELPIFHSAQDRLDREAIKMQGERLQVVAKEMEKKVKQNKEDENAAILRRLSQEMKQLGKDMKNNRIPKKQAMLKMNDLQKQIKENERNFPGGNGQKSLDKVSTDLQQAAQRQDQKGDGEGAKALRQMAENVQKRDFDAAKKQLEELAKKMQAGKMTADEAKQAAETLREMAKSMQGSSLDKASEEMKQAARDLQKAAETAQKFQQQMANAKSDAERQQLQQQMSQQMQQGMQQAGQKCEQAGGT